MNVKTVQTLDRVLTLLGIIEGVSVDDCKREASKAFALLRPIVLQAYRKGVSNMDNLQEFDLSTEEWREYDFDGRIYRILNPTKLFLRPGGTTHRVVDVAGVTHCVPAPGHHGCVLRWKATPVVSF